MAGIQLSGLASGFDWKSFVDQVMDLERTSVVRLENEQARNSRQINALETLNTKVAAFRAATAGMKDAGLYTARLASSSEEGWAVRADAAATLGEFSFDVTQLATATRLSSAADRGRGIAPSADVSGILVSDLPVRVNLNAGFFTVNGARVEIALTDTVQDVFDRISTATAGAVTASYDPATDSIDLQSASEIVLGASNDTANFTYALGLFNNGSDTIAGQGGLGVTDIYSRLPDARLREPVTAVDGNGDGSFTINGVEIAYNLTADSINDVIARINSSAAGVRATWDSTADGLVLTNTRTGDSGMTIVESAGGLMDALGVTAGATLARGKDARFSLNGGTVLTSPTNALDASMHGITGVNLTAHKLGSTTVTIGNDSDGVRSAIDTFIAKYNDIQDYIEEQTKITRGNDKVETATLSGNREVDAWSREMRSLAFSALDAGAGAFHRLEALGIDFRSGTSKLEIKDPGKLTSAIENALSDVQDFFTATTGGFAVRMEGFINRLAGSSDNGGYLGRQTTQLDRANSSLDAQIERLERQLEQRRSLMESGFIAMETAQQRITAMQDQLSKAFPDNSAKK